MTQVETSKLVGYAVTIEPDDRLLVPKLVGYAVLDIEHAQVYASKLVAYAVVTFSDVGRTIEVTSTGSWSGSPTSFDYQWRRNGVAISGETASSYTVVSGDVGTAIDCLVTAHNAFGSGSADSNNLSIN